MKNLFVGNMSFQTTESDLQELFKPFGQITRIHGIGGRLPSFEIGGTRLC